MEAGQPFPDFVLQCARAMGACAMMRDDPFDAPIPEFKPSDYYVRKVEEAKADRHQLLAMTDEEKIAFGVAKKADELASAEEYLDRETLEILRLSEMRDRVTAWEPPTSEHVGLKDFMLDQINISMNRLSYSEGRIAEIKQKFARDYYDEAVAEATRQIDYGTVEMRKENERTEARNRWVRELKASIT